MQITVFGMVCRLTAALALGMTFHAYWVPLVLDLSLDQNVMERLIKQIVTHTHTNKTKYKLTTEHIFQHFSLTSAIFSYVEVE